MNKVIDFQQKVNEKNKTEKLTGQMLFSKLLEKEAPNTLIVSCSDPYSMPQWLDDLTGTCSLVIQNLGALVHPFENEDKEFLCNLNYSIRNFSIENIVIIGHGPCLFLDSVLEEKYSKEKNFMWIKDQAQIENFKNSDIGREIVFKSCENLWQYTVGGTKISHLNLNVYGWYFDSETNNIEFVCGF